MFVRQSLRPLFALAVLVGCAAPGCAAQSAAELAPVAPTPAAQEAGTLAGTWELSLAGKTETCRLTLRPERAFNGDFYAGLTPACRHAMPEMAKVGHWGRPDATHLKLAETTGASVLVLAAVGQTFAGASGGRAYTLRQIAVGGPAAGGFTTVDRLPDQSGFAPIVPISKRSKAVASSEPPPKDLGGRYAILREKRDTGCMLTLDESSRAKGGDRAQLAPGCRDQGIVIFDPASWAVVKGELVLTARAGHKTHLLRTGEGRWEKDTKDGGKPLGLKKL